MATTNLVIKPPDRNYKLGKGPKLFLAGSIEMGKAEDWQTILVEKLHSDPDYKCSIFNPRRDDWDSSWEQSIENDQFREQVTWELDHMDHASIIPFYFAPDTQSPITLLELGRTSISSPQKLVVCCPKGFWRKGNVDIVCARHDIQLVETLDEMVDAVNIRIVKWIDAYKSLLK